MIRDYNYVDFIGVPFIWPVPLDLSLDSAIADHFAICSAVLVRHRRRSWPVCGNIGPWQTCSRRSGSCTAAWHSSPPCAEALSIATKISPPIRWRCFRIFARAWAFPGAPRALERFAESDRATGNFNRLGETSIQAPSKSPEALQADDELRRLDAYSELLAALVTTPNSNVVPAAAHATVRRCFGSSATRPFAPARRFCFSPSGPTAKRFSIAGRESLRSRPAPTGFDAPSAPPGVGRAGPTFPVIGVEGAKPRSI